MRKNRLRIPLFRRHLVASTVLAAAVFGTALAQTPQYRVQHTWHVSGDSWWDYLTVDPDAHRLYIARGNKVQVVDTQTGKLVGEMGDMQGTHGIALDQKGKSGYISDGGAGVVRVFDRATLKTTASIPAEKNPDAILFDPATQRVFAFNGRSQSATAIDTGTNKALKNIPLPGKPEFAQADGKGNVYVNIEDKNEIVRIDANSLQATATWPIAPCDSPSGLTIDRKNGRLFSVCDNHVMTVVDANSGKVVATVPIGAGPDATRYDAKTHLVFSPNGRDGTLTVVQQMSPDKYKPVQNLTTQRGARTMALDSKTGTIYLVTAGFGPPPPATAEHPHPRPSMLPNSFVVLAVGK